MKPGNRRLLSWLIIAFVFLAFFYGIRAVLPPFVIGALAAYFLDPAADRLERQGLSRAMATSVITVTFFSVVVLILLALIPLLVDQLSGLLLALPGYAQALIGRYQEQITSWLERVPGDQ